MATKQAKAKIKGPYDTAANWSNSTRILLKGEKVYARVDSGSVRSKTGDGTKTFRQLPYDDEAIYQSLSEKLPMHGTADKAIADENGNDIVTIRVSATQPSNQSAGDIWCEIL